MRRLSIIDWIRSIWWAASPFVGAYCVYLYIGDHEIISLAEGILLLMMGMIVYGCIIAHLLRSARQRRESPPGSGKREHG